MKKILALALILILTTALNAQNLMSKINNNASAVLVLNGNNIFNKISETEFENSSLFKELSYEMFRGKAMAKPSQFADMGIKTKSKIVFAVENATDIIYYYSAYEIEDFSAFSKFIKAGESEAKFETEKGLNIINYDNDSKIVWNNQYAFAVYAVYTGEEFRSNDYYWYSWDDYETLSIDEVEQKIEILKKDLKDNYDYEYIDETSNIYDEINEYSIYEAVESAEETVEYDEESIEAARVKRNEKRDKIKDLKRLNKSLKNKLKEIEKNKFIKKNLNNRVNEFFKPNQTKSFKVNGFESTAAVSIWYNTADLAYIINPRSYNYLYNYNPMAGFEKFMQGNMVANMFLKDDKIELKAKVNYSGEIQESIEKIYNSKIDSKFLKYISNDVLAYSSISLNSQSFYEEMANITKSYFSKSEEKYAEEIAVYIDFLSILIDEEAIGELITGDALFILNDLKTQMVEYKQYEYDENFNSTEITKTKEELLPEFTVMFGSKNDDIIQKLIKLGHKHELIIQKKNYFILTDEINELPFNIYVAVKDDIIFVTNSTSQLASVLNGKSTNKVKGIHKKMIKTNVGTAYFNLGKTTEKVLLDEEMSRELGFLFEIKDDLKEFFYTADLTNGNFEINSYLTINEGSKNSAHYLLHIISQAIDYEKNH